MIMMMLAVVVASKVDFGLTYKQVNACCTVIYYNWTSGMHDMHVDLGQMESLYLPSNLDGQQLIAQGHSSDLPSTLDGPWVELH